MRSQGSSSELEHRRILAVQRIQDGYSVRAVARFLGVARRSVQRWQRRYRQRGLRGLQAVLAPGRAGRLDGRMSRCVRAWIRHPATDYGFSTDRWTARRVQRLLQERLGVRPHVRTVRRWIRHLGITPQIPAKVPLERDEGRIAHWCAHDWPRIKKKRFG